MLTHKAGKKLFAVNVVPTLEIFFGAPATRHPPIVTLRIVQVPEYHQDFASMVYVSDRLRVQCMETSAPLTQRATATKSVAQCTSATGASGIPNTTNIFLNGRRRFTAR